MQAALPVSLVYHVITTISQGNLTKHLARDVRLEAKPRMGKKVQHRVRNVELVNTVNPAVSVLQERFVQGVTMTQRFAKIVQLGITRIKKVVQLVYRAFLDEHKEKKVLNSASIANQISLLQKAMNHHASIVQLEKQQMVKLVPVCVSRVVPVGTEHNAIHVTEVCIVLEEIQSPLFLVLSALQVISRTHSLVQCAKFAKLARSVLKLKLLNVNNVSRANIYTRQLRVSLPVKIVQEEHIRILKAHPLV